jgi:WhiB family redox-sensing transcriptional regulator
VFFPSDQHPDGRPRRETARSYKDARAICDGCPVREPCLEHALEAREPAGMWGGLTTPERAKLRRARRQAAKAT